MPRKKCLYLLSLALLLAAVFCLSSLGWAAAPDTPGDRLTVSGTFKNPSNKGVKEVEVEVLVNGKHVTPEGKEEDIATGKQGTFMREFSLPAGTLPAAKVEVTAKKPSWEPLKPTPVSVVDGGTDAKGNRLFQAAGTFTLQRAVTPAFWIATFILLAVYVIISPWSGCTGPWRPSWARPSFSSSATPRVSSTRAGSSSPSRTPWAPLT